MNTPQMTCPQCHADLRRHAHKMSCTEPGVTRQDVRKLTEVVELSTCCRAPLEWVEWADEPGGSPDDPARHYLPPSERLTCSDCGEFHAIRAVPRQ